MPTALSKRSFSTQHRERDDTGYKRMQRHHKRCFLALFVKQCQHVVERKIKQIREHTEFAEGLNIVKASL